MIKKTILVVGGLGLLAVLTFGRDAVSYVSTSAHRVSDAVRDSVPIEFEIDRARKMVKNLIPDIRRNMHVIAKEEVEVEELAGQIEKAEAKLMSEKSDVMKLRTAVSEGRGSYIFAGRRYSHDQVTTDLARRFERYKTSEATLDSLRDIYDARVRSLDAAREKLQGMLAAKRQLEVDVENLEARLKMVEVAQTTSDYNFDDSNLARTKELIGDIRTRLTVAEKLVNADVQCDGEIPLDETVAPEDIVDQVTEYFGMDQSEPELATASF